MAAWLDPRTKRSVAFYAFLTACLWDVVKVGLTTNNLVALGILAGVGGLGLVDALKKNS